MSHMESYADEEDLADFIVSDEDQNPQYPQGEKSPFDPYRSTSETNNGRSNPDNSADPKAISALDKLRQLSRTLRGHVPGTAGLLRAHISILVSALGGPDHASENRVYKLGHDALACLKDLKRWLRAVDEKNGTFDVALACAECDLVKNDLTVILCQYEKPEKGMKRPRSMEKVMLACLELLVLLTWPIEVNRNTLLKDYTAKTSTRRAQLAYKHHILHYKQGLTLKAVLRLGLGALKAGKDAREPRDLNILRLILFFIRNVLYIEPLPATKGPKAVANASVLPNGISSDELLLSAVLTAFNKNNVLLFLTSIAHSVSTDIVEELFGLLAMECVALLTRGADIQDVLDPATKPPRGTSAAVQHPASSSPPPSIIGNDLQALLVEESRRKSDVSSARLTRHGRFGTLLSIRNPSNASYFAVSGQRALTSTYDTLEKLDSSKKWHKPTTFKYDLNAYVRTVQVALSARPAHMLARFISELLLSGSFNNLLTFVGRHFTNLANDRETGHRGILDAVDPAELAAYFATIAWFFRYKRERTQAYASHNMTPPADADGLDHRSVGAALSEVNFILLLSYFRLAFETRDFDSLHVAMACFKEMLMIANAVFSKKKTQQEIDLVAAEDINEDRELAEGVIRKLFSQKQFLDMCVNVPKNAYKHSPEYLSEVVSVVHILLKSFESLANEDMHLFIKTRRKVRKLNQRKGLNAQMDMEHWDLIDRGSDEEADDEIQYTMQERKLDLRMTEARFFHPETVATHIEYLSRYEDLSADEIKCALAFFHRLFVVRRDYSALYRLDFMLLLYKLQGFLPKPSKNRRHVDDFIVYFMGKFKVAFDRFPTAIEMLFPRLKTTETIAYLNAGDVHDPQTLKRGLNLGPKGKNSYFDDDAVQPRAAPLLQFHDENEPLDEKIGILVYYLAKKKNTVNFMKFLTSELTRISQIPGLLSSATGLRLTLGNRRLLISDPHLRLLVESIGFALPYLQNDETTLRATDTPSTEDIKEAKKSLDKWMALHLDESGVGDIEPFLDQIQRIIWTSAQLAYGVQALADMRAGNPIDAETAAALDLDAHHIEKVIGLAKRSEYDEQVSTQFYPDDEFTDSPTDSDSTDVEETAPMETGRRKRRRLNAELSDAGFEVSHKFRRRGKKSVGEDALSDEEPPSRSAKMVHDSDDESDDERNNAFFEREEKLQQLILQMGGIASNAQLNDFKKAWAAILDGGRVDHVTEVVEIASGLFVGDLDYKESSSKTSSNVDLLSTTEDRLSETADTEAPKETSRKRRIIMDDDEDED